MRNFIFFLFIIVIISCSSLERGNQLISPETVDSLLKIANSYYEKNDFSNALFFYDKIEDMDTGTGELYYKRGYCKAQLFKYEGSILDYNKALEFKYRTVDTYFNIACDYAALNNDSLALKYFIIASELDSSNLGIKMQIEIVKSRLKKNK